MPKAGADQDKARETILALLDERVIDVTQGGLAVDLATVRGPIRLRLRDG